LPKIERQLPPLTTLKTDKDDPNLKHFLIAIEEPKLMTSKTERADPMRLKLLSAIAAPTLQTPLTEKFTVEPPFKILPTTERDEPIRTNCRREIDDPKWDIPSTDMDDPSLA